MSQDKPQRRPQSSSRRPPGRKPSGGPGRDVGKDGRPSGDRSGKGGKPSWDKSGSKDRDSGKRDSRSGDSRGTGGKPSWDKSGSKDRDSGKRDSRSGGPQGKPSWDKRDAGDRESREPENALPWPDEIFDMDLDPELRAELEASGGTSGALVKHLLSVQVLADDDPEGSYQHAERLRQRMPRSALARQTACIAGYRVGRFREAIKDEAAYRRISNNLDLVPIAADSERGLGRPERALAMIAEFEPQKMDSDTRTELLIVAGGARQDLGDLDAARVFLQKAVRAAKSPMAHARSRFALGMLLLDRDPDQARKWLESAAQADPEGIWTEAAETLESL